MRQTREQFRLRLVGTFPKSAKGVEIGVFRGSFSEIIYQITNPASLDLVDPWRYEQGGPVSFGRKRGRQDANGGVSKADILEEYYQTIVQTFTDRPNVRVCRQTSDDYFAGLDDNTLDFIYIDGDHRARQVRKDVANALRVVKPGGIISGDDLFFIDRSELTRADRQAGKPGINIRDVIRAIFCQEKANIQTFDRFGAQWFFIKKPA